MTPFNKVKTVDYHDFCTKDMSKEERKKLHIGDIYSNSLVCNKCGEEIRSKNKHDFRRCGCGACAIDGGSHYVRVLGKFEDFELRTIYFDDVRFKE